MGRYDFVDGLLGDVEDRFLSQRVPSLFLDEVEGFVEEGTEDVV